VANLSPYLPVDYLADLRIKSFQPGYDDEVIRTQDNEDVQIGLVSLNLASKGQRNTCILHDQTGTNGYKIVFKPSFL